MSTLAHKMVNKVAEVEVLSGDEYLDVDELESQNLTRRLQKL